MKAVLMVPALLVILFAAQLSKAQVPNCIDLKNGIFVSFSLADGSRTTYTRKGEMQKEVDTVTHESPLGMLNG